MIKKEGKTSLTLGLERIESGNRLRRETFLSRGLFPSGQCLHCCVRSLIIF
jgi:hypothetical protein